MSALPDPQVCPNSCPGNNDRVDPDSPRPPEQFGPIPEAEPAAGAESGTRSRRKRGEAGGGNVATPRMEAAAEVRGTAPDYRAKIMARAGVLPQALPIDIGAPLATIVSSCAEAAKIAPSTAALVIATMASATMGQACVFHGQESSDRTAASGLSLAVVTEKSAGAAADLAVQVLLQVEARNESDEAGAGPKADSEALRDLLAACAARGYDVVRAKSAKPAKPAPHTLVLENATLRGLERVWPGIAGGLLVVSRDSMPILPPQAGPVGAIQGHLDGLQLGNSVKVGAKTRRCSIAVIGAFSPDGVGGARLRDGAYHGVIQRMIWAPCDGARRTIEPPADLVAAMARLSAVKTDEGTIGKFCLDTEATRRFRRVAPKWSEQAQEAMPPLRQSYEGAGETMLRVAAALHALGAAVAGKPVDRLIPVAVVNAAISLVRASLATAESLLGPVSVPMEISHARAVVGWLRGAKGPDARFTLGEVERALSGAVTPLEVKKALMVLHENGLIEWDDHMESGRAYYKAVHILFE